MSIMDGMVNKKRMVKELGKEMSLCDLGYCDVGLDDNWQACGSKDAAPGMHYHDVEGNPLVNTDLFPDFNTMTSHAHKLGLTSGWYGNNCICSDHCNSTEQCEAQIEKDVAALMKYDFDAWKLDGCGGEIDLVTFNKYIEKYDKPIMIENCHWGVVPPFKPNRTIPAEEGCPWNFYRSSGDVRASYASVVGNLATVQPLHDSNLSYPGCWAYPDMLQVGCQHGPGGASDPGLSMAESRSHFGSWAIVSSPLTLSHDVNNDTVTEMIWDIIANTEVIAVNQAYHGDSGGVYDSSDEHVSLTDNAEDALVVSAPSYQYLYKPVGEGRVAVLLMNAGDSSTDLTATFADVPTLDCGSSGCAVRDIWNHKDLGTFKDSWTTSVGSHDAAFVVLAPASS